MKKSNQYFPSKGTESSKLIEQMTQSREEDFGWKQGKMFGFVYYPGEELAETQESAFKLHMHDSRLNPTAFNSLRKMENEVVSMVVDLLHGDKHMTGSVTSGGTESILMSMKVARDFKRVNMPGITPEVIVPVSVHPAFDKAAQYLDIKLVKVPLRDDFRVNIEEMAASINENTSMLVGSAPTFPHGVIDPIEEIAALAQKHKLLCHVDACLGGFMLPFVEDLGYPVAPFDFRVRGVSSISADAHKYGYSAKGASLILYRDPELRKHQFFVSTDWPGGIFASSTFQGSRGGGPLASVWAMIKCLGFEGYREIAEGVMKTVKKIQDGIKNIEGLDVVSNPEMSVFAIRSNEFNIYEIGDEMANKGWLLDRLQNPACIHLTISKIQTDKEDEFLNDLMDVVSALRSSSQALVSNQIVESAVSSLSDMLPEKTFKGLMSFISRFMKNSKGNQSGSAALYGITAKLKNRKNVKEMILSIYDQMYRY